NRHGEPGRERRGRAAGGDGAGARRVGVELDRRAGLGAAAHLGRVVVGGGGGRDGEGRARGRGGGGLDVGEAARAGRDVSGGVRRRRVERRRGVVAHRDREAGGREGCGSARSGHGARARRVRVELDRGAGLGRAAHLRRVVVGGGGGRD